MREKIKVRTRKELDEYIKEAIDRDGLECSLNHIDVSEIKNMNRLFAFSEFNGDISEWDTSGAEDMAEMFLCSHYEGSIEHFNLINVFDITDFLYCSKVKKPIWYSDNLAIIREYNSEYIIWKRRIEEERKYKLLRERSVYGRVRRCRSVCKRYAFIGYKKVEKKNYVGKMLSSSLVVGSKNLVKNTIIGILNSIVRGKDYVVNKSIERLEGIKSDNYENRLKITIGGGLNKMSENIAMNESKAKTEEEKRI